MLEILYDKTTKEVRAWNADDAVQGNFKPKGGQEVVIWNIPIPSFDSGEYKVNVTNQTVVDGNPSYVEPEPPRDLATEIDEIKAEIKKLKDK